MKHPGCAYPNMKHPMEVPPEREFFTRPQLAAMWSVKVVGFLVFALSIFVAPWWLVWPGMVVGWELVDMVNTFKRRVYCTYVAEIYG